MIDLKKDRHKIVSLKILKNMKNETSYNSMSNKI